jgi:DNA-binding winged helix-turn-helix (wHTH) protein
MAPVGTKTFWEKLRWFKPITVFLGVMPLTLLLLHYFLQKLGLTPSTLILLVVTVFYSLGSGIWVAVILSLESDLYLNYYLTRPFHSFRVSEKNGVTTLIVYVLASTTVSALVKLLATKQNEIQALLSRIENLATKSGAKAPEVFALGNWEVDLGKRAVADAKNANTHVHLTPIEWKILEVLVKAEGGLVSQQQVLREVWGDKYTSETNYLRLYLSQLRKKLEATPKRPVLLITEAGAGYRAMATRKSVVK